MATDTTTPQKKKAATAPKKKAAPKKAEKTATPKEEKSSTFAVIETGGKQYKVAAGDVIKIEKIDGQEKGGKITFDSILLLDNGTETKVGDPYLSGVKVEGEILDAGRDRKIPVIKFRSKSRYFVNKGHRQPYLSVKITSIK